MRGKVSHYVFQKFCDALLAVDLQANVTSKAMRSPISLRFHA